MAWDPKDPPRFGGLEIDGVPPFQGSIEFTFDRKVNVFIGPNATGKSTILKVLYPEFEELYALQNRDLEHLLNLPDLGLQLPKLDQPAPQGDWITFFDGDWLKHDKIPYGDEPHPRQGKVNLGTVPLIYLPPIREVAPPFVADYDSDHLRPGSRYKANYDRAFEVVLNGSMWEEDFYTHQQLTREAQLAWLEKIHTSGLGGYGFLGQDKRIAKIRSNALEDLDLDAIPFTSFDCNRVYYALQRLWADDKSGEGSGVDTGLVLTHTYACLRDICPEVIQGEPANIHTPKMRPDSIDYDKLFVPGLPADFAVDYETRPGMGAHTVDSKGEPLYWGVLSTGTQGLFWWICYLALKMAWHYLFYAYRRIDGEGWERLPAILLIDEIENHLHPTWQRRVIPALRKHFPGLQIFATTHSPFVVAGLKRGQVHRLYREKGVIKTDKLTEEEKEQQIIGWTVEEILRKFMDVTDPTDEATATAAATLRWLRGTHPSDSSAAHWVQECLRHLKANPERDTGEEQALRWLSENQPEGQSDATAEEWWLAAIERLRSAISPDLEAGGPIAAQTDRFLEEIERIASEYGIKEEPDEEEDG